MTNSGKVFHSPLDPLREKFHVVLVRPELGSNVGSVARGMANMGIRTPMRIVGHPSIIDSRSRALAKHARDRLDEALFFEDLEAALNPFPGLETERVIRIAATARAGSPHRPHPLGARDAVEKVTRKLAQEEVDRVILVFGPEGDGLTNAEVEICDWVATIPSSEEYRSLNLAQAVLVFCYEVNVALLEKAESKKAAKTSQKDKLVSHLMQLAEQVGFILPGDPYKMKPTLEGILSHLPNHIEQVKTLHGFIDQVSRSIRKGEPDFKGRYRYQVGTKKETYGSEQ